MGTRNIVSLEIVEFGGKNVIRDITFENESALTPNTASDNVHGSIHTIEEEADQEPQYGNVVNIQSHVDEII